MFIVVPAVAIALKRAVVWTFKKVTGRDKIEAAEREEMRRRYENPDWAYFEGHLGRSIPRSMKSVWESARLLESPIVRLGEEEYFLYPIHSEGLSLDGFYPLGQNELGAAIFVDTISSGNTPSVFSYLRSGERQLVHDDADEFFSQIADENDMIAGPASSDSSSETQGTDQLNRGVQMRIFGAVFVGIIVIALICYWVFDMPLWAAIVGAFTAIFVNGLTTLVEKH